MTIPNICPTCAAHFMFWSDYHQHVKHAHVKAYEPWNPSVEIYEFKYNALGLPVDAQRIK